MKRHASIAADRTLGQIRHHQRLLEQELEARRNQPHVLFDCHLSGRVRGVLLLIGERHIDADEAALLKEWCDISCRVAIRDAEKERLTLSEREATP